jgi:methylamine--corrinoid protein Co-methyltransferase
VAHTFCDPIYGGYLGGKYGVAIGCVAGCILLRACLLGDTVNAGPSHTHLSCDTHPDMIAAQALSYQALSRNTHLLNSVHIRPAHGPGVRNLFYEVATMAIAGLLRRQLCKSVRQPRAGIWGIPPLKPPVCWVAHAEGRGRIEEMPGQILVQKYRDALGSADIGRHFREVYDLDTLQPGPEWMKIYEEVVEELRGMGLPL